MRSRLASRIATVVVAVLVVAVLVVLAVASGAAAAWADEAAVADPCRGPLVVGVRGSGEDPGLGTTVVQAVEAFDARYGAATDAVALDYPAARATSAAWRFGLWHSAKFRASVTEGITALQELLTSRAVACPDQAIVLFGYSQGALVIDRALVGLAGDPALLARVGAVGLISDPARLGGSPIDTGSASRKLDGVAVASGVYSKDDLPEAVDARARSVCVAGDLVCAYQPGKVRGDPAARHGQYKFHRAGELGAWAATLVTAH